MNNDVKKLKDIYELNDSEKEKTRYGIQFYVLNRFVHVLYHDLLCMRMKENDNHDDDQLLFPKLQKFYKFLYNFAIYCHCYVHFGARNGERRKKETEGFSINAFVCCPFFF